MAAKPARPSPCPARPALVAWSLLVAAALAVVGCRPSAPPQAENTAPPPVAPAPETTTPEPPAPESPTPEPTAAPTPAVTAAPTTTAAATLPDTFIREWQPLSNVLLAFGPMTVTPDQVQWGSGQSSPYTLISTDGGYLLQLEANPTFYDNPNRYIKLIPKAEANGASTSIEVAFYTDAAQIQSDEYVMYGSYFTE